MTDKTNNQQKNTQNTTTEQRAHILRTADRAANNQTRTQPHRTH